MSLKLRVARWAGTLVRVLRPFGRVVPGLAGAAALSVGLGQVAGHVFGHGLTWWVALAAGGVFVLWFGAELNRVPPPVRDDSE